MTGTGTTTMLSTPTMNTGAMESTAITATIMR